MVFSVSEKRSADFDSLNRLDPKQIKLRVRTNFFLLYAFKLPFCHPKQQGKAKYSLGKREHECVYFKNRKNTPRFFCEKLLVEEEKPINGDFS